MLQNLNMYWKKHILSRLFSINTHLLGDDRAMAWSNLGLWHNLDDAYPAAAQRLAKNMGEALQLKAQDHILDLGCGYGASLCYWQQQFQVTSITGLELQKQCCDMIAQQNLSHVQILHQSLFEHTQAIQHYDVIVSLDCAYHYTLQDYLNALEQWRKPNTRIGFHFLMLAEHSSALSLKQRQQLSQDLSWAKVDIKQLLNLHQLTQQLSQKGYEAIEVVDLSEPVLQGFHDYVARSHWSYDYRSVLDLLKIKMTAKLCGKLAQSQAIRYVQVTAQYQD